MSDYTKLNKSMMITILMRSVQPYERSFVSTNKERVRQDNERVRSNLDTGCGYEAMAAITPPIDPPYRFATVVTHVNQD